jgi:hypothetical protein
MQKSHLLARFLGGVKKDPFLLGSAALWKVGSALHANVSIVGRP